MGIESIKQVQTACSWDELGLQLKHPECPIAVALDAASAAVVSAVEVGVMDEGAAKARLRTIGLRRASIAATQAAFGCPRESMDEEASVADERSYSCKLPSGLVESFAYGNMSETITTQLAHEGNGIGFNSGQQC